MFSNMRRRSGLISAIVSFCLVTVSPIFSCRSDAGVLFEHEEIRRNDIRNLAQNGSL